MTFLKPKCDHKWEEQDRRRINRTIDFDFIESGNLVVENVGAAVFEKCVVCDGRRTVVHKFFEDFLEEIIYAD